MSLSGQPPLPPPPVQCPPAGWLGYLGIKSGGAQPGVVNPVLQPVIDMDRFYRAGQRTALLTTAGAYTNNANTIFGAVPAGKVWLVDTMNAGSSSAQGAVAGVTMWGVIFDPMGVGVFVSGPSSPARALTGEFVRTASFSPIICLPGYQFGIFGTAANAPTAFNVFISVFGFEASA